MFRGFCFKAAVVAGALAAGAATVHAQDASHMWSGPYVGVAAGGTVANIDGDFVFTTEAPLPWSLDLSGGVVAGIAGFNVRSGNMIFGVEGDFGALFGMDEAAIPGFRPGIDMFLNGHIRGRAGILLQDDLLLFGAIGLALAGVETDLVSAALTATTHTTTIFGLSVGAGAELALTERIRLRAEYIYDHYFDQKLTSIEDVPFGEGSIEFPETRTTIDQHTFRIGVTISLN